MEYVWSIHGTLYYELTNCEVEKIIYFFEQLSMSYIRKILLPDTEQSKVFEATFV